MESKIVQYEINIPFDYMKKSVLEIAEVLGIKVNENKLIKAIKTEEIDHIDNLCIFYDLKDKETFIIADCNDRGDWLYTILVRCRENVSDTIKKKLLEIDSKIRMELDDDIQLDLENTIDLSDSHYCHMIRNYGIKDYTEIPL